MFVYINSVHYKVFMFSITFYARAVDVIRKKKGSVHRGRVSVMVNHMVLGTCIKLVICLALFFCLALFWVQGRVTER